MPEPAGRPSSADRIRAALWFAQQGFGIFPVWSTRNGRCRCPAGASCSSPGKHPLTQHGFQEATTDEAKVRTFLAAASEPNWGMVPPEGVFIWDVDTDDERATLARLADKLGSLPATLHDTTAHGEHVFWRWPDSVPRPLKRMFGLVTRWGSGRQAGYVIGPHSVHSSGAEYRPATGSTFAIATLPEAWARAAVEGEAGTVTVVGRVEAEDVRTGHRHDWLRDTARLYAGTVRDPEALFAAVWAANEKLPEPKTREEVERAIGDVLTKFGPDEVEVGEDGELHRVEGTELGILPPTALGDFPPPPVAAAFGGLIGECVEDMARGTDASLVGILASFLAVCGAMVPAHAYARGEQTSSPFIALVGESSIGRKGTAMHRALGAARNTWQADHVNAALLDGLNSGEALVSAIHERKTSTFNAHRPAVALVFEDEFASMLQSRGREGSTLDQKMRLAFDGSSLSNRRRAEAQVVQPPYWLPALAAITPVELRSMLDSGATRNGSANRWLYVPVVKRDVIAPDEEPVLETSLTEQLLQARGDGKERRLGVHPAVSRALSEYAEHVMRRTAGVAADLVRRYQTLAIRIALIHAAVERSSVIEPEHLERALALTEYARSGITWVFGQTIGNRDADLLLRHLQQHGVLRKNVITRQIVRDPIRQQDAIDELVRLRLAQVVTVETRGRMATELRLTLDGRGFRPPFVQATAERGVSVGADPFVLRPSPIYPNAITQPGWTKGSESTLSHAQDGFGRKVDESRTKAGKKVDGSRAEADPVDHSTGETQTASAAVWKTPCGAYEEHRSSHRMRPEGWVCIACAPEEER